ncbi:hypothetical protein [Pseudomonas abyssi]|uniref:hypothetical protein n=1 Tax=Pseudomonas abyssi TaxID=170540 RepID=UPI003C7EAC29
MWPLKKKRAGTDWEEFLKDSEPESRKRRLIRDCQKYDVTPYVDDVGENALSSNVMRGVASEAEIERRLLAKKAVYSAQRANVISIFAFIVAFISMAISLYENIL